MAKITLQTFEVADFEKVINKALGKAFKDFPLHQKKEKLELLSRKETAKTLCISLPTLNQWTKDGVITAYRIGNRVLYKIEDIKSALKEIKAPNFKRA